MAVYVVTGASRGLGYALIINLASNPSNTVFGLARDAADTEARLKASKAQSSNLHILQADITDQPALNLAAQKVREVIGETGGVDVLINNAGYVSKVTGLKSLKDFEDNLDFALQDTQKSFDINVFGTLKAINAFLPLIRTSTLKKVVAISSGMGDIDLINEAKISNAVPYAASKAALSTITAKLHAAYEDEGLLFMSLCPGSVDTAENPATLSEEDLARLSSVKSKFAAYAAPGFGPRKPSDAAKEVLEAIGKSTLEGGYGGSFLSYNGTKRWM